GAGMSTHCLGSYDRLVLEFASISKELLPMRSALVALAMILCATAPIGAEPKSVTEQCPITVDLPLAKLFAGKEASYRTGKASALQCEGASASVILLERHPAANGLDPRIHVQTFVSLASGQD